MIKEIENKKTQYTERHTNIMVCSGENNVEKVSIDVLGILSWVLVILIRNIIKHNVSYNSTYVNFLVE